MAADGGADPVEARRRNEAVIVEIERVRARLDASVDASRQAVGAADLAIEQAKASAQELLRSQRRPALL